MNTVFVDTSAFVALADKKDKNHARARHLLRQLARGRRPLVTSTYVADEVITLVRMRMGHGTAVEVGDAILRSAWCRMLEVEEATRVRAWSIFTRFNDQEFSFTDCTSFALMRMLELDAAFTFDRRDFAAAGFTVIPAPAAER